MIALNDAALPDEVYAGLWADLQAHGLDRHMFWDGGVLVASDFAAHMRKTLSLGIWDQKARKWVFLAWGVLKDNGWLAAHFTAIGQYRRGCAETVQDIWAATGITGILGVIPEPYLAAQKLVAKLGWKRVGVVPRWQINAYTGKRQGAVIFHQLLRKDA